MTRVVGGYLRGQTIASFATGLARDDRAVRSSACPYALVLGLITFIFNYIPYVGPFIAGLIAALVGLFVGPWTAVLAIVVIVVAQNVTDTLITPRVMSDQVDLHPILVIFSLLVGGTLFGIPGMLFAIPVAATGKGLFVYYYEQRTQRSSPARTARCSVAPAVDPDDRRRSRKTETTPGCPSGIRPRPRTHEERARELRRDPRELPVVLREQGLHAPAVVVAHPRRPVAAAHDARAWCSSSRSSSA